MMDDIHPDREELWSCHIWFPYIWLMIDDVSGQMIQCAQLSISSVMPIRVWYLASGTFQ